MIGARNAGARRVAIGGLLAAALLAGPAAASAATSYSTNWAGYVASASRSVGSRFRTVSGSWTQPTAACTGTGETFSAVWVGLGGYSEHSKALEQVGTDADCTRSGKASYASWFELVPASPVNLRLTAHPGDHMGASVTVIGRHVTFRLRDDSTGALVSRTLRLSRIDVSSAEWIVEAPSICERTCEALALTNFGTVTFTRASATARAHVGSISDANWRTTRLILRQSAFAGGGSSAGASSAGLVYATPTAASAASSFSVAWSRQGGTTEEAPSGPSVPGFSGGGT
jgi:hypothetical protein